MAKNLRAIEISSGAKKKTDCDSFQFQRLLEIILQSARYSFGIRMQKFGRRIIGHHFRVMVTFSSKWSVVRTFVAFGPGSTISAGLIEIVSSSKRLIKSQNPEYFLLEFFFVDCNRAASIDNSSNFIGSSSWPYY